MATRHRLGAIATAALASAPLLPAEAAVYRIQARPLPTLVGRAVPEPDLSPATPGLEVPGWLDWARRLMDGGVLTFVHPTWEGPVAGLHGRIGLEAGLKGRMDLGYGPALVFNGRLSGRSWGVESQATVLATSRGVSWLSEVTLGRPPWTLNLRVWEGPGASSLGQSATLVLRRGF